MDLGILSGDPSWTRLKFASGVFAFAPENTSESEDDADDEDNDDADDEDNGDADDQDNDDADDDSAMEKNLASGGNLRQEGRRHEGGIHRFLFLSIFL